MLYQYLLHMRLVLLLLYLALNFLDMVPLEKADNLLAALFDLKQLFALHGL